MLQIRTSITFTMKREERRKSRNSYDIIRCNGKLKRVTCKEYSLDSITSETKVKRNELLDTFFPKLLDLLIHKNIYFLKCNDTKGRNCQRNSYINLNTPSKRFTYTIIV